MVMVSHRVTARNGATSSENKIHDDDVARRFGFRGGLVPGVTLYGYMTRPVLEGLGAAWLERGTFEVRFEKPVYDGQQVTVAAVAEAGGAPGAVAVELRNPDDVVCAKGRAVLPASAGQPPDPEAYPVVEAPGADRRPPADETSLAPGTALATLWSTAGSGDLILGANGVLTASVVLGPWIHVGSAVTNFRRVADGLTVETRARVADRYERKGHQFVVLDVIWLVEGHVAMHASHVAIYRLRGGTMVG